MFNSLSKLFQGERTFVLIDTELLRELFFLDLIKPESQITDYTTRY